MRTHLLNLALLGALFGGSAMVWPEITSPLILLVWIPPIHREIRRQAKEQDLERLRAAR